MLNTIDKLIAEKLFGDIVVGEGFYSGGKVITSGMNQGTEYGYLQVDKNVKFYSIEKMSNLLAVDFLSGYHISQLIPVPFYSYDPNFMDLIIKTMAEKNIDFDMHFNRNKNYIANFNVNYIPGWGHTYAESPQLQHAIALSAIWALDIAKEFQSNLDAGLKEEG